ncbi:MAG TPA: flagellar biosynthetic protein FliR [Bryobacteraceae bacterium]|jgi:flagellar biosynthetic protein FliR
MPIRIHFGPEAIVGFLLTLTRVGSALFFLPLPGFKDAAAVVKVALVVGISFCLFPFWASVKIGSLAGGQFAMAVLSESAAGLLIGLAIALLHETFQFAAQAVSMQSGFSFASIYDPSSKADTGVFLMMTQLAAGFLFFAFGVHHQLLRILARSFEIFSFSGPHLEDASIKAVLVMGATMFTAGLKLGLPLVVLLLLVEFSLALLSRLHAQLNLLMLSFPAKTALSLVFLAAMMARWPSLYEQMAQRIFELLSRLTAL